MISGSAEAGSILGRVIATRESGMAIRIENGMKRLQRRERRSNMITYIRSCFMWSCGVTEYEIKLRDFERGVHKLLKMNHSLF